jgi:flagellar L-ring protein precursor FlgH
MRHVHALVLGTVLVTAVTPSLVSSQAVPPAVQQTSAPVLDLGWLADGRRFLIGDIITVVVDEYTAASADRATSAQQDRASDAGLSVNAGGRGGDGTLGSFMGSESSQRGRDVRQDRLTSEVSVRVTGVEPNGALRVEGKKMLVIDDHQQEVTVRGVIRTQDITSQNTVDSWRIAEAEVLYATDGKLGKPERGMLMKLLGFIIP